MTSPATPAPPHSSPSGVATTALAMWTRAYRVELAIVAVAFVIFAGFSGRRFLRQSAAPHFVYQAQAWLEGHQHIEPEVMPNIEDWACVREVSGVKTRCTAPLQPGDRWYSSFPAFPSAVMLPFVAVNGYQLNDTSFGVIIAALALALMYSLLRALSEQEGTQRAVEDNLALVAVLGLGSVFFYCAIRGEVWFLAEVMGVGFTALYLRNAVGAKHPFTAGLFWSMAVLTRTPLFFTGVFFVYEALMPAHGQRLTQWKAFLGNARPGLRVLGRFALGAAPLGLLAMWSNQTRFGAITEFGHRFFFDNRVNVDIDTHGLFALHYLTRNLDAAFLKLPVLRGNGLSYDPWGLSLFITLPVLALAVVPSTQPRRALQAVAAIAAVLVASALFPALPPPPGEPPIGHRPLLAWVALAAGLGVLGFLAWRWATTATAPRLLLPTLVTLLACMLPGLLYQNTGYAQFGFRFSLDYTPYLIILVALGRWDLRRGLGLALAAVSVAVGVWGAVAFRGYTELVRQWP